MQASAPRSWMAPASMVPSWPPPRTPILLMAASSWLNLRVPIEGARFVLLPIALERIADAGIFERQDAHGKGRGVGSAPGSDGKGRGGDARGHLHDGEQAVEARERLRLHRHPEDGQRGERRDHARQV